MENYKNMRDAVIAFAGIHADFHCCFSFFFFLPMAFRLSWCVLVLILKGEI